VCAVAAAHADSLRKAASWRSCQPHDTHGPRASSLKFTSVGITSPSLATVIRTRIGTARSRLNERTYTGITSLSDAVKQQSYQPRGHQDGLRTGAARRRWVARHEFSTTYAASATWSSSGTIIRGTRRGSKFLSGGAGVHRPSQPATSWLFSVLFDTCRLSTRSSRHVPLMSDVR
jgi:hypothetical protein